jgi:hypothetical protein
MEMGPPMEMQGPPPMEMGPPMDMQGPPPMEMQPPVTPSDSFEVDSFPLLVDEPDQSLLANAGNSGMEGGFTSLNEGPTQVPVGESLTASPEGLGQAGIPVASQDGMYITLEDLNDAQEYANDFSGPGYD